MSEKGTDKGCGLLLTLLFVPPKLFMPWIQPPDWLGQSRCIRSPRLSWGAAVAGVTGVSAELTMLC